MSYRNDFLAFAIQQKALSFGSFTLKSGRVSPYFFNAGQFSTGRALSQLGQFYAQAIVDARLEFDMLFGPAYKGIPLVSAVAIALAEQQQRDYPYAFNRKEAKDHGEGGVIVGAPLKGRVLVIDDVITAGTAIREAAQLVAAQQAQLAGVAISLDRQERGQHEQSAVQEVETNLQVPVVCIASLADIIEHAERFGGGMDLALMQEYRQVYGV